MAGAQSGSVMRHASPSIAALYPSAGQQDNEPVIGTTWAAAMPIAPRTTPSQLASLAVDFSQTWLQAGR